MKFYRVSPFNFAALVLLLVGLSGYIDAGVKNNSILLELYLPVTLILILLDLPLQYFLRMGRKTLWISEGIFIAAIILATIFFS